MVLAETEMVMVEFPEPGAGMVCGLKLTVVPDGTPEAERLTALLKPPQMVLVMVDVPLIALHNADRRRRSRQLEILYRHDGQRDRGALLDAASGAGNRDGISPNLCQPQHADGHGRAARTRRRNTSAG